MIDELVAALLTSRSLTIVGIGACIHRAREWRQARAATRAVARGATP